MHPGRTIVVILPKDTIQAGDAAAHECAKGTIQTAHRNYPPVRIIFSYVRPLTGHAALYKL